VLKSAASLLLLAFAGVAAAADPLPGTKPLTEEGELHKKMVDGIHKYLDREIAASVAKRKDYWKPDFSSPEAYLKSIEPNRERLRKILGVVDKRLPPNLEYVGGPDQPALVGETDKYKVFAVRWAVLPGVDGEGLLLEPKGKILANVVAIPDADQTPEQLAGLAAGVAKDAQLARRLAESSHRVIVPVLIDRNDEYSANPRLGRGTNQPHREFIYRMAYEMGRHIIGYEVQKVLAAIDWFGTREGKLPVGVIGYGEGGLIAYYSGAVEPRIRATLVSGCLYNDSSDHLWQQPIYRNVWSLLPEFGPRYTEANPPYLFSTGDDSRYLIYEYSQPPQVKGPPAPRPGRGGAAPGALTLPARIPDLLKGFKPDAEIPPGEATAGVRFDWRAWAPINGQPGNPIVLGTFHRALAADNDAKLAPSGEAPKELRKDFDSAARQKRQFDQLVAFTQKLWRDSDAVRREFWKKADYSSVAAYEKSTEAYRDYFHTEVIGKLPEPTMPLNPRTRVVYDEPKWTGYEVMLDVYPDVFASGILLLPKDLKPGEKRPVVVCQHGLEGTPRSTIDPEKQPIYAEFSKHLCEKGYIVYAPQNPYVGQTHFRQIQRKAQPLKLALFSFIVRQHQRTIDFLETLPNVDPKRIAFYGLSYGGKTAMRVPAIEKRYCLSICSADFNEWVGKNVSVELPMSYMWTMEYDMYEFDLGNTFNYAEMAFLIAPRPFMVERGHDDGVGIDEMVSYEYAKIRYLYANRLKIPDRTEIEYQPGGHRIFEKGTYAFLAKHLKWEK
jgi:dienelactone hydrolase